MIPVLIDTDMGIDDAFALCLLASCPDVQIAAATAVGGNVSVDQAAINLAGLCKFLQLNSVPLGKGLDQPARGPLRAINVDGDTGLGAVQLPPAQAPCRDASDVIASAIDAHAGKLNVLAIGPLTNLADLAGRNPQLFKKIDHLFVMGGAVFHRGNVTPFAEFNFYRDPSAAQKVLALEGVNKTLVPLDVTQRIPFDEFHLSHLSRSSQPAANLLAEMMNSLSTRADSDTGPIYIHDAVAAAAMIWPERFLHTVMHLDIVTQGPQAGRCKPTIGSKASAPATKVLTAADVPALVEEILLQVTHEPFV